MNEGKEGLAATHPSFSSNFLLVFFTGLYHKHQIQVTAEVDERDQMKRRIKALETALADAHLDLVLERAYTQIACERAGIEDVGEFKKKAAGKLPIAR
jgi:hypothetical protein